MKKISESLRKSMSASGLSMNALARETGVPQPVLTRFLAGRDMKLVTADKLAAYFGLELRKVRSKKG